MILATKFQINFFKLSTLFKVSFIFKIISEGAKSISVIYSKNANNYSEYHAEISKLAEIT